VKGCATDQLYFSQHFADELRWRTEKAMKTKSKISGHIIRSGAWVVFLSVGFMAATLGFD
jgi:hypothetical protein